MRTLPKFILSSFLFLATASATEEKTHDITVQIHINCPESPEFTEFVQSIPAAGNHSTTFEEWKTSFVANMLRLVNLVESEQVNSSSWGVNSQEHVEPTTQENGQQEILTQE